MINRQNWQLVKNYLAYRVRVDQLTSQSAKVERAYLRYILEWAQETSFLEAPTLEPGLPKFVLTFRLDKGAGQLSPVSIKKTLACARRFFSWLIYNQPRYKSLKIAWVDTLKAKRVDAEPKSSEVVSYEEILAIANTPAATIRELRIRAAAVFLYLSGMRIGAFVSLPIKAIDFNNLSIKQFPNMGVKTKNGKYAETFLLPIPKLIEVARKWDDQVRSHLLGEALWFAKLKPATGELEKDHTLPGEHRHNLARKELRSWLIANSLPYRSPHKFRHGHIHWAASRATDWADYKAVSLNVMHTSTSVTDVIYSKLEGNEVRLRIASLAK
jgi:integrase